MTWRQLLVVDDDRAVRAVLAARLVQAGHAVRQADCGAAALNAIERGFAPDLVCTDVDMPGEFDGLELAAQIRQRCPNAKLVVMSGRDDIMPPDGGIFVGKAGGVSNVLAEIERLLN